MEQGDWLSSIKARRWKQTIKAAVCSTVLPAGWLCLTAVGVWAWVAVFHHLPPSGLFLKWYVGLGSLVVIPLGAFLPLAPMKGKDPEVIAADEFFRGPPR